MAQVQKSTDSSSLAEVVDRILERGIVIDAWAKVSLVGIELLSIEARVVIASVETYLKYAEAIGLTASAAAPAKAPARRHIAVIPTAQAPRKRTLAAARSHPATIRAPHTRDGVTAISPPGKRPRSYSASLKTGHAAATAALAATANSTKTTA